MATFIYWLLSVILLVGLQRVCCAGCCDCGFKPKKSNSEGRKCNCKKDESLHENFCLKNCPAGYYKDKGKCTQCINTCATCVKTHCSSCNNSFLTLEGSCSKQCKSPSLTKNSSSPRTRLVQGRTSLEGRVEVYYNGSWGTLCDDGWNMKAAVVICRELNLGSVVETIVDQERFPREDGFNMLKIWLSGIECKGNENTIAECDHKGWGNNNCSHLEDVGVRCSGPDTTKKCVRSCGDGYYKKENHCIQCPLDCKTCNGSDSCLECVETRFLQGTRCVSLCAQGTYGKVSSGTCEACPQECLSCAEKNSFVICTTCPADLIPQEQKCVNDCGKLHAFLPYLRLSGNKSNPYEGRIEIRYEGEWHTVCDDKFHWQDARVICREMGYGSPISFSYRKYGAGTGKILADDLQCTGSEESFLDCPQKRWFSSDCTHSEDVDIACSPPDIGSTVIGKCVTECGTGLFLTAHDTCELCNRECATCVTSPDKCTTCREPYYLNGGTCSSICPDGMYASTRTRTCEPCDSSHGCRTCDGTPDHCLSCIPPTIPDGTKCLSTCGPETYRKGHVCVADCGLMHYGNSSSSECHACPLNCRTCNVVETNLVECKLCVLGYVLDTQKKCVRNCPPGYFSAPVNMTAVGIQPTLRLAKTGLSKFSGRLEVLHNSVWGAICNRRWPFENSIVACKQMLLGPPKEPWYSGSRTFRNMKRKFWLDNVVCKGDEEKLSDCKHRGWGIRNCFHFGEVHLECSYPGFSICQKQCPMGYFANESVCEPCDDRCLACVGLRTNCSKCVEDFHLNMSGACVDSCPSGYYTNANKRCLVCTSSCGTCEGSGENCTSCISPYFLSGNKCVSCIPPKLRNGTKCVSSCPLDKYRKGRACVADCGVMHYTNLSSRECQLCPSNCRTCQARNSNLVECKICVLGYVLDTQNDCVKTCPSGYFSAPVNLTTVGIQLKLRLTNTGVSKFSGRLEVLHNGVWGTICGDLWRPVNAKVACAQMLLGPPKLSFYQNFKSLKERSTSKIWLDDVICKGDEKYLSDCKHRSWGVHNCGHSEDVHLECSSPGVSSCQKQCPMGYFGNGNNCEPCNNECLSCFGLRGNCSKCVEGFFLNETGACIDRCPSGYYTTVGKHCFVCNTSCWTCEGSGENCTSCHPPYFLFGNRCVLSCPAGMHKHVYKSKLKLISKKGPYEGVVQVSKNGQSGIMCDSWHLTINDGNVICNELYLGKALKVYVRYFDAFRKPFLIRDPLCIGNETSIFDCPTDQPWRRYRRYPNSFRGYRRRPWRRDDDSCSEYDTVSVRCSGPDRSTACLDGCPASGSHFITSTGACLPCLGNCTRCVKTATNCTACIKGMHLTWNNKCVSMCPEGTFYDYSEKICKRCFPSCRACYREDYCIHCIGEKFLYNYSSCETSCYGKNPYKRIGAEGIRLYGGKNVSTGLVEVFLDGMWSSVFGVYWDMKDAAVVCRQLGYGDAIRVYTEFHYDSELSSRTVMYLFHCNGKEIELTQCGRGKVRYTYQYAGVECTRASPSRQCVDSCGTGYFLLVAQNECRPCSRNCISCSGTADNCTACDVSSFLSFSRCFASCPDGYYGNLRSKKCERCHSKCKTCLNGWTNNRCASCSAPYFLKNTDCVDDCYPDYSLTELMKKDHSSPKVRLVNGSTSYEGRLEIFHNGQWGALCSPKSFHINLACQELGYEGGWATRDKYPRNEDIDIMGWIAICERHESILGNCLFTSRRACYYEPTRARIMCSKKPLDKRVCRKINPERCSEETCFDNAGCVDGDGTAVPKDSSFCMHCPKNYFGDGDNCTETSLFPPTATVEARNYTVRLYNRLHLYCSGHSGDFRLLPGRYSWKKNGEFIHIHSYSPQFSNYVMTYMDAGMYSCTLRNLAGFVTVKYYVSVVGYPLITSAADVDGVLNSSVVLTCNVLSNPTSNITWYFKGSAIIANSSQRGPNLLANGSLQINKALKSDAGIYTCEAINPYGGINGTLTLRIKVIEEPHFEEELTNQELKKGEIARFKCEPSRTNPPMKISWRKNGRALQEDERITVNNQSELVITDVSQDDCGEYYCVAKNEESVITSIGTLTIIDEYPCIHTPPRHLSLEVGMYARFYCRASGVPDPVISWKREGRSVYNNSIQSNVYEIKSVSISDVGIYICSAKSGTKETNAYAFLSVDRRHACPYIHYSPKDKRVKIGEQATFRCEAVAVPYYNITWYLKHEEIKNNSRFSVTDDNQELVIRDVEAHDAGDYSCVVQSPYGQRSAKASLRVDGQKIGSIVRKNSRDKVGIVVGVLFAFFFVLIVIYFLWRYRRDGSYPSDVFRETKEKALLRFSRRKSHVILRYDTDNVYIIDDGE